MNLLQMEKSSTLEVAYEKAEAEAEFISLERDDLARVSFWFHDACNYQVIGL
jgi:hypothetical protein